jgi:hypothetical protein
VDKNFNRIWLEMPMTSDLQARRKWFQTLDPVLPEEMVGLWRGKGIAADHPLDGVLENLQSFGKRFHPDLKAHALLFQWRPERLVRIEPSFFPIRTVIRLASFGRTFAARKSFSHLQKIFRARGTTAMLTLRMIDGAETAAMVYDRQPIAGFFRHVDHSEGQRAQIASSGYLPRIADHQGRIF